MTRKSSGFTIILPLALFALLMNRVAAAGQSIDILEEIIVELSDQEPLREVIVDPVEESTLPNWSGRSSRAAIELLPIPIELEIAQRERYDPTLLRTENRQCMRVLVPASTAGPAEVRVLLERPILVNGIVKTVSFWFRGPDSAGVMAWLVIADLSGIELKLPIGKLDHPGWYRYSCYVLPTLTQQHGYRPGERGIRFLGLAFDVRAEHDVPIYLDRISSAVDFRFASRDGNDDLRLLEETW